MIIAARHNRVLPAFLFTCRFSLIDAAASAMILIIFAYARYLPLSRCFAFRYRRRFRFILIIFFLRYLRLLLPSFYYFLREACLLRMLLTYTALPCCRHTAADDAFAAFFFRYAALMPSRHFFRVRRYATLRHVASVGVERAAQRYMRQRAILFMRKHYCALRAFSARELLLLMLPRATHMLLPPHSCCRCHIYFLYDIRHAAHLFRYHDDTLAADAATLLRHYYAIIRC